ncbi:hypothetical protein D3OALGA1CA_5278 [Olavius algarvensis associated proteobacterium Delta 3]|nr:hypothetical protein D3OALGB2SA_5004 [Olavius algarvensis associated proteobacterium Delta 3]CAB5164430.1 hypothetical protein D3OALGA1CA_5278 [Olavius algarvensis associated proteobacterium Delta 3]
MAHTAEGVSRWYKREGFTAAGPSLKFTGFPIKLGKTPEHYFRPL